MIPRYLVNLKANDLKRVTTDYLVIGTGIAGLTAALELANSGEVTVLAKDKFDESNTKYAQGGIAAAWSEEDNPKLHFEDTINAGAGLCNQAAVQILVSDAKKLIKKLINWGVNFDKSNGGLALTKEGAHSKKRILHARGDATGAEISSALVAQLRKNSQIKGQDNSFVLDLVTENNSCQGAYVYDRNQEQYIIYQAKAVILATGGSGNLYATTSNPKVATGDGLAIAYRAGAELMDLEMMQFHPTVLKANGADDFLISEAVRGEGAKLRRLDGSRFMDEYHQLAELAPRDIVARAIEKEISKQKENYIYLDLIHLEQKFIKNRFPNIYENCLSLGIDITKDYIPVAPAAHYFMGGIKTDLDASTNIERLFACGEAACLGIHGANRLASNSLLEGLVYGSRAAKKIKEKDYALKQNINENQLEMNNKSNSNKINLNVEKLKTELQSLMKEKVAIVRDQNSLTEMLSYLEKKLELLKYNCETLFALELYNMLTVASLMTKAALLRTESRGAHYRKDYPNAKELWKKHIIMQRQHRWRSEKIES